MHPRCFSVRVRTAVLALATSALVACSSSDPSSATTTVADSGIPVGHDAGVVDSGQTDAGGAYDVEYVQVGGGLTVGKSTFQLRVKSHAAGIPAPGLASSIAIAPVMSMSNMSHGSPVPVDAVKESSTAGTYDVTLFFPMASVDGNGNPAGQWTLKVAIGQEAPVSLPVTVAPHAGTETTHKPLQNANDKIASMGGSQSPRKYMLFRDSLEPSGGGYTLGLFLATIQEGMMVWPPVTTGLQLKDKSGQVQLTVSSVDVSASTDGTNWTPMTCGATARCTAALSALAAGVQAKVYVKLKINGQDYTTDGAAPDGDVDVTTTNAFATFVVMP